MRPAHSTATALVVLALALSGCAGADDDTAPADAGTTTSPDADPTGAPVAGGIDTRGAWVLTAATIDGQDLQWPEDARIDLAPTEDGVGGRAACNLWFGNATVGDGTITIGQLGQTEMACAPPLMQVEADYLDALARVSTWQRNGDGLTLAGDGVELVFVEELPPSDEDLVGVRWELESLVAGDAVSSVADDAFLELSDDGTLVGATGCRVLEGEWVMEGATVTVTTLEANGQCDPDVVDQDDHVVSTLGTFTVAIEGDRLTITTTQGTGQGLVYRAAD